VLVSISLVFRVAVCGGIESLLKVSPEGEGPNIRSSGIVSPVVGLSFGNVAGASLEKRVSVGTVGLTCAIHSGTHIDSAGWWGSLEGLIEKRVRVCHAHGILWVVAICEMRSLVWFSRLCECVLRHVSSLPGASSLAVRHTD